MKKIRVMHILTDSNIGGAGRLLYNLSACVDKSVFEFVLVFSEGSDLVGMFDALGVRIYTVKKCSDRSFSLGGIHEIGRIIKKDKPDIVHTHSSLSGRIASRLSGVPRGRNIYTRHCVFGVPDYMKNFLFRGLYRAVDDALCSRVIAVAEAARRELVEFGVRSSKIDVVINGSHPLRALSDEEKRGVREELGIKNGEFVVGISARLEKYKGHEYLIKAAEISARGGQNIRFIIMGDGTYRGALEKYAKKLGVFNKNIIFLGFVNDVGRYVNIFDVNVNCSVGTETSSLSISEGLSVGVPAIVSDFGGNPNMVINGVTGYVIKKADPEALYAAIIKIKNNGELRKKMKGSAKNDFAHRFSEKRMSAEYEKIYAEIMQKKQSID